MAGGVRLPQGGWNIGTLYGSHYFAEVFVMEEIGDILSITRREERVDIRFP